MDDLRKIAYCLAAAGGAVSEDGFHLLYEKNHELVEELWDTTKVRSDAVVGEGVKTNAPAAYILVAGDEEGALEQRMAFSIDTENTLKSFAYSTEDEEWEDTTLGNVGSVKVHPSSALAADVGPDGVTLFFQNEQAKLQTLVLGSDGWALGEVLSAAPRPGTPLSTVSTEKELLLFYLAVDDVMHYQARNVQTETWEDRSWDTVQIPSVVSRFKVSHDAENDKFEAHVITDGKLVRFAGTDTDNKVELGVIKGREFTPSNAAQSVRRTFMQGLVIRNGRLIGARETHQRTHHHKNGSSHTTYSSHFYPI